VGKMRIDTRECQFEMYLAIGKIPVRFFNFGIGLEDKINYPEWMMYDGKEYILKNKDSIDPYYEELK
jgi:hypothetical protein